MKKPNLNLSLNPRINHLLIMARRTITPGLRRKKQN
jgi:hypothetical protein